MTTKPKINKYRRSKLIEENDFFIRVWMMTKGNASWIAKLFNITREQVLKKAANIRQNWGIDLCPAKRKPNISKETNNKDETIQ